MKDWQYFLAGIALGIAFALFMAAAVWRPPSPTPRPCPTPVATTNPWPPHILPASPWPTPKLDGKG